MRLPSPQLCGSAIRVQFRPELTNWRGKLLSNEDRGQPVHASCFLTKRQIVLESALLENWPELSRILVHEVFHFSWVRLGNPLRSSYHELLRAEMKAGARGELGWSAEWRKEKLTDSDVQGNSRRWREYAVESFCDTAAYIYSDCTSHAEFTLRNHWRVRRIQWYAGIFRARPVFI